jgi:hypothetical protein
VAVNALDVRMARLEGAYEQINARLGSLEQRVTSEFATLRAELRESTAGLRADTAAQRKEVREDIAALRGDAAEQRKRIDLILIGVFFAILLQIAIRVFFP